MMVTDVKTGNEAGPLHVHMYTLVNYAYVDLLVFMRIAVLLSPDMVEIGG